MKYFIHYIAPYGWTCDYLGEFETITGAVIASRKYTEKHPDNEYNRMFITDEGDCRGYFGSIQHALTKAEKISKK